MDVSEAIRLKRAVRTFASRPLSDEVVKRILWAGRRAQSAKNTQPWHFVVVRQRQSLEQLAGMGTFAGHLAGAAMAVVIATPDPAQRWSILFDAGQAAAYMQLAAWELGVGSCLATLYEAEAVRRHLSLPADWHAQVAVSFGYPADPLVLTAAPARGGRRPHGQTLHFERWPDSRNEAAQ
jgi:nitroreductase